MVIIFVFWHLIYHSLLIFLRKNKPKIKNLSISNLYVLMIFRRNDAELMFLLFLNNGVKSPHTNTYSKIHFIIQFANRNLRTSQFFFILSCANSAKQLHFYNNQLLREDYFFLYKKFILAVNEVSFNLYHIR